MRDVVLGLLVLALATLCIVERFQFQKLARTVEEMATRQAKLERTVAELKTPPPAAPATTTPAPAEKKSDADPLPADAPRGDVSEKVLLEAQDLYVRGQYKQAIESARRALSSNPTKAYRIIGAANCFLKNRAGAREAWNALAAPERSFLTYVCSRNHVTLP